ncbi:MAG: FtsQ-type POTRA domain-containing protein [Candidatus Poribacteria bacterium]|nr:FtsQ-type POTRA domain-containing protein [Candidatus Poribacteria bacterium]
MKLSSRQYAIQPKIRPFPERQNAVRRARRRFVLGITSVIAVLFIYHLSSTHGFFQVKHIAVSGSNRYTPTEIIAASGLSPRQRNVHTISTAEIENRLKRELSYIKQANISKSVVKRSLKIEVTEREAVALLEYLQNSRIRFVLVDLEGYVLEYVESPQPAKGTVTIIGDRRQLPQLGSQVYSDEVQLALKVLRTAIDLTPDIVPTLHTIDANQPDKITLQFSNLPVVWISSDRIETEIYHISLFMKHRATVVSTGQRHSNSLSGYIDARFEGAIYWGRQ